MDKKWINKNKDLLYENSVSLATAEALMLEEDILFKEKLTEESLVMMMSFGDSKSVELTDGKRK